MWKKISLVLLTAVALVACSKNALSGRKQLSLFPDSEINSMSFAEYKSFLQQNASKTMKAGANYDLVKRVGNDIRLAAEHYYKTKGMAKELQGFAWEFNVVDDPTVNAFCMPGGKVVVYTGILNVTKNEDALAVVMGHEISHALLKHGNERMSQGIVAQLGLASLDIALSQKPQQTRELLMTAAGAAVTVGALLPFSRRDESEADKFGLYFMAMAGYHPDEAAPFWDRMNKMGGSRPPEFLSTHPDPEKRSTKLKELSTEAKLLARKYPTPGTSKRK